VGFVGALQLHHEYGLIEGELLANTGSLSYLHHQVSFAPVLMGVTLTFQRDFHSRSYLAAVSGRSVWPLQCDHSLLLSHWRVHSGALASLQLLPFACRYHRFRAGIRLCQRRIRLPAYALRRQDGNSRDARCALRHVPNHHRLQVSWITHMAVSILIYC
jgi:hypothetical protein